MAFDIVTYALSKKYVNSVIEKLPKGFVYKGAVNYEKDLPVSGTSGDVYTVLYKGTSGTDVDGREFVWGDYKGINQWIPIGTDEEKLTLPKSISGQGVNIPYYFDVEYGADKATVKDYTIDISTNSHTKKEFSIDINAATASTAGLMTAVDAVNLRNKLPSDIENKVDKVAGKGLAVLRTVITDLTSTTVTVTALTKTDYIYGKLTDLNITFDTTGDNFDEINIQFSSGATATTLTIDNTNGAIGNSKTSLSAFVPNANSVFEINAKRYNGKWILAFLQTEVEVETTGETGNE